MLVGHYAAAYTAKAIEPRLPFWLLFLAAQAVDIMLNVLVFVGVEKLSLDFTLPSNPLVIEYVPFTHSLLGNLCWAVVAFALLRLLKMDRRLALIVALTVLSHWFLDVMIHRHDMTLWGNEPKLGTELWNHPLLANALELIVLACSLWFFQFRNSDLRQGVVALQLAAVLVIVQLYAIFSPPPPNVSAMMASLLMTYMVLAGLAAWLEGRRKVIT